MSDELHKELKFLSVSLGVTMSDLLMKAVHIITKQKGIEETTFIDAFDKPLSSDDELDCRRYTKKQLEEYNGLDRI